MRDLTYTDAGASEVLDGYILRPRAITERKPPAAAAVDVCTYGPTYGDILQHTEAH